MKKIEIGLDLTKETKKVDNFIVHGDSNPDCLFVLIVEGFTGNTGVR